MNRLVEPDIHSNIMNSNTETNNENNRNHSTSSLSSSSLITPSSGSSGSNSSDDDSWSLVSQDERDINYNDIVSTDESVDDTNDTFPSSGIADEENDDDDYDDDTANGINRLIETSGSFQFHNDAAIRSSISTLTTTNDFGSQLASTSPGGNNGATSEQQSNFSIPRIGSEIVGLNSISANPSIIGRGEAAEENKRQNVVAGQQGNWPVIERYRQFAEQLERKQFDYNKAVILFKGLTFSFLLYFMFRSYKETSIITAIEQKSIKFESIPKNDKFMSIHKQVCDKASFQLINNYESCLQSDTYMNCEAKFKEDFMQDLDFCHFSKKDFEMVKVKVFGKHIRSQFQDGIQSFKASYSNWYAQGLQETNSAIAYLSTKFDEFETESYQLGSKVQKAASNKYDTFKPELLSLKSRISTKSNLLYDDLKPRLAGWKNKVTEKSKLGYSYTISEFNDLLKKTSKYTKATYQDSFKPRLVAISKQAAVLDKSVYNFLKPKMSKIADQTAKFSRDSYNWLKPQVRNLQEKTSHSYQNTLKPQLSNLQKKATQSYQNILKPQFFKLKQGSIEKSKDSYDWIKPKLDSFKEKLVKKSQFYRARLDKSILDLCYRIQKKSEDMDKANRGKRNDGNGNSITVSKSGLKFSKKPLKKSKKPVQHLRKGSPKK